jgi:hypothetical protein
MKGPRETPKVPDVTSLSHIVEANVAHEKEPDTREG